MMKFNGYTRTAIKAAIAGGKSILKFYGKNIKINFKGKYDPVTNADTSAQKAVIKTIKKYFPDHGFLAEETVGNRECKEFCWIIDPLDGTVNFIHNIPLVCVSVALNISGKIVSGVVHCPVLGETFVAERGKGTFLNGKKISVSRKSRIGSALMVTGFPYERSGLKRVIRNFANVLEHTQGVRRLGSAAIDLAYVAAGRFEAFWEEGLQPWDVAAGSLIVEEAGGKITDYCGGDSYIENRHLLATNGILHDKMLKLIKK